MRILSSFSVVVAYVTLMTCVSATREILFTADRKHEGLRHRDQSLALVARSLTKRRDNAAAITNTSTVPEVPTTFNFTSPTALAKGNSLSTDISFSRIDTTLLPPDSSIVGLVPYAGHLHDVRLSCLNCTSTGEIELVAGGFSTNETDMEILSDFVDNGYLQFKLRGFTALMDFELEFLPGFSLVDFTAYLPNIPLGAIEIAGLLKFGPVLELVFPISVTLNSPVALRTGFVLTAPPEIDIYLNMSHPASSYTKGLSEAYLQALPFTADIQNLSMNLTTGFKPQLVLAAGIDTHVFNASADGGIGVYLDLPQLAATIDIVDHVNEHCEHTASKPQNNLIRVDSSVTYGGGAEWDISANILGIDYDKDEEVPWISNTTVLPTQCLMWDVKKGVLVKATALPVSTSILSATSKPTEQAESSARPITSSLRSAASQAAPISDTLSDIWILVAVLCFL